MSIFFIQLNIKIILSFSPFFLFSTAEKGHQWLHNINQICRQNHQKIHNLCLDHEFEADSHKHEVASSFSPVSMCLYNSFLITVSFPIMSKARRWEKSHFFITNRYLHVLLSRLGVKNQQGASLSFSAAPQSRVTSERLQLQQHDLLDGMQECNHVCDCVCGKCSPCW